MSKRKHFSLQAWCPRFLVYRTCRFCTCADDRVEDTVSELTSQFGDRVKVMQLGGDRVQCNRVIHDDQSPTSTMHVNTCAMRRAMHAMQASQASDTPLTRLRRAMHAM